MKKGDTVSLKMVIGFAGHAEGTVLNFCKHQEWVVVGYGGFNEGAEVRLRIKKKYLTTVGDAKPQPVGCLQPVGG